MADASRFPHLALPFALVGAAGGWLSAGLVEHPVIFVASSELRLGTGLVAGGLGLVIGALLRRWCVRRQYPWEVDVPDPEERLASDSWLRHVPVILAGGAAAGSFFAVTSRYCAVEVGILGGLLCTLPFLPVCAAVLSAARRAQRARLGSIVAGSDRRAVWGILATALLVCTLEALPDWPAPRGGPVSGPAVALGLLVAAITCIALVLAADLGAWRRANRALSAGLGRHEGGDPDLEDDTVARLDLGLGEGLLAKVSRTNAVYRARNRTLELVKGDPEQALGALRRAVRRGVIGLGIAGAVCAAHGMATTDRALAEYELIRCDMGNGEACGTAGLFRRGDPLLGSFDPGEAMALFEQGCHRSDGASCMSVADLYRGKDGTEKDSAMVAMFEYRAAQQGLCPDGTRLVRGTENVCVDPLDPRR